MPPRQPDRARIVIAKTAYRVILARICIAPLMNVIEKADRSARATSVSRWLGALFPEDFLNRSWGGGVERRLDDPPGEFSRSLLIIRTRSAGRPTRIRKVCRRRYAPGGARRAGIIENTCRRSTSKKRRRGARATADSWGSGKQAPKPSCGRHCRPRRRSSYGRTLGLPEPKASPARRCNYLIAASYNLPTAGQSMTL